MADRRIRGERQLWQRGESHRPSASDGVAANRLKWSTEGFDTPDLKEAKALPTELR
jgi:hypothetical protein